MQQIARIPFVVGRVLTRLPRELVGRQAPRRTLQDGKQMTLIFSDRIRVAETVCNETENYGK